MKKLIGFLILATFLIGISFSGCRRSEKGAAEGITVALVLRTLNNPFFIDMHDGAQEAAQRLGIDLIVQGSEREFDVEKQMQIMENMILRKVDAICLVPVGSKEVVAAIVKANKANIPVLVLDNNVSDEDLRMAGGHKETFIGSDNLEGGRIAGEYLAQKLSGEGKIAILEGVPGHEAGDERLRGFLEAVEGYPQIEIVSSQTANWEMDQGFNVFQNILESHPQAQALFSCNDNMALGAIEAINAAGRTGDIIVVGFDAIEDAKRAIEAGTMEASIAQNPYSIGKLGVEYAHQLLNGKDIPDYVPTKIELITKENL